MKRDATGFTWLNKQGVRSDKGFEFQRTGRFAAEYRESGRVTEIAVESGIDVLTIHERDLEALWSGIEDQTARTLERSRILQNLRDALEFQNTKLDLVSVSEPRL